MEDVADVEDSRDADAALRSLPPLPEPNRWEQRSEACCGASLVCLRQNVLFSVRENFEKNRKRQRSNITHKNICYERHKV